MTSRIPLKLYIDNKDLLNKNLFKLADTIKKKYKLRCYNGKVKDNVIQFKLRPMEDPIIRGPTYINDKGYNKYQFEYFFLHDYDLGDFYKNDKNLQ